MRPVKSLLLSVLLLTILAAGIYVGINRKIIKSDYLAKVGLKPELLEEAKKSVNSESISSLSQSAQQQSQTLLQRGGVVLGESKEFIDTQVTASETEEPLHNKAFEYARYLYCQQVIEDYESK